MEGLTRIPTQYSYSSAVIFDRFVFIGLHRGFGPDFRAQFRDTMTSVRDTLKAAGADLSGIVKVHVWLKHISDLPEMEKLFKEFFQEDDFPARMTATTEFIDEDCLLMIDGTAVRELRK